jgi:sugar lactone lactonase YvrE
MKNTRGDAMIRLLLLGNFLLFLLIPTFAFSAETLKFRPLQSITTDATGRGLKMPHGVACDAAQVGAADTWNGRLLRYQLDNGVLIGGVEIKSEQIPSPVRVQISRAGEIFVLDGALHKIARLGADGTFVSYVEPEAETGSIMPQSFRLDSNDNLWILDSAGSRVIVLDAQGKRLRQIAMPVAAITPLDLDVAINGDVVLLDSAAGAIYLARSEDKAFSLLQQGLFEYLAYPAYLLADRRGMLVVIDKNEGGIGLLGADGTFIGRQLGMGWKAGLLNYPEQACFTPSGIFIIADRNNGRLQTFATGQP